MAGGAQAKMSTWFRKSHMKIYPNSGNNIDTSKEITKAILSFGGIPSARVTSSGPPKATNGSFEHKSLKE